MSRNGYDDVDFEVIQRITVLEEQGESHASKISEHDHVIDKVEGNIRQIRNALYLMALVQAYQIPELKGFILKIIALL